MTADNPTDVVEAVPTTDEAANAMASAIGENGKVLNQDEIDSLLGFDNSGKGDNSTRIQAMLDKALSSYERLPMLEVVFDRLVRMMSTSLRNLTSDNVDVSLESINSLRFGDYINAVPLPALLTIFKAVEWENYGIITANSQLIFIAEALQYRYHLEATL